MPKKTLAARAEKQVSEMSIGDVLQSQTFFDTVAAELKAIQDDQKKLRFDAMKKGLRLKRHPIDFLEEKGYLVPGEFIVVYSNVVNKTTNLSSSQRHTVIDIGNVAFHKAMRILIEKENEATGKTTNGND